MRVKRESELAKGWEEGVRKVEELNEISKVKSLEEVLKEIEDIYDKVFRVTMSSKKKELFFRNKKGEMKGCVINDEGIWSWEEGVVIGKGIGKQTKRSRQAKYEDVEIEWKLKAIKKYGKRIANELSSYQDKNMLILKLYKILNKHDFKTGLDKVIEIRKPCELKILTKGGEKKEVEIDRFLVKLSKKGILDVKGKKGNKTYFKVRFPLHSNERNFWKVMEVTQIYPELKEVLKEAKEKYKEERKGTEKVKEEMLKEFRGELVKRSI